MQHSLVKVLVGTIRNNQRGVGESEHDLQKQSNNSNQHVLERRVFVLSFYTVENRGNFCHSKMTSQKIQNAEVDLVA